MSFKKKGFLKFSFFALLFLALIVAWLGFGERGFIHLFRMEKKRQIHMEKIQQLEEENQKLLEEINRLRTDKKYLESVARKELGLIKEDEVLYRFEKEEGEPTPEVVRKKIQERK